MSDFLDAMATVDTLIERLDDGDCTGVHVSATGLVALYLADPPALARAADLLGADPYLLPRRGTPVGQHARGSWRGVAVAASTGFAKRRAA